MEIAGEICDASEVKGAVRGGTWAGESHDIPELAAGDLSRNREVWWGILTSSVGSVVYIECCAFLSLSCKLLWNSGVSLGKEQAGKTSVEFPSRSWRCCCIIKSMPVLRGMYGIV